MLVMPYWLALKAEVLHLADRTSEALEAITEAEALVVRTEERWWCAELHRAPRCLSHDHGCRRELKSRLRSAQHSESRRNKSQRRYRNAPKQPMRNTADKRRAGQEDTDFDYLFGDCSQRAVSRFGCRKSSVIKQTLEMQSEDISATAIR
jgi:hypothetical protein